MSEFISEAVSAVWGIPLLLFLLLANIYLFFVSKFKPIAGFMHAWKILSGRYNKDEDEGQLSHFQALSTALSATIGLGNISGVAVAISQGGPGAILWMWVAAFLGMNTKFFECTLAVIYRGRDYTGEIQGGPMYVIDKVLGERGKLLSFFFTLCGLFGTLSLFQINQFAKFSQSQFGIPQISIGISCSIIIFFILWGGIKRIGLVTSKLVPLMGATYIISCLVILVLNIEMIPEVFKEIFLQGFTGKAAIGGLSGYAIKEIIISGVKRATFSNEAGIGTAPMAHANAKTSEPVREGYVAMLGPFLDTIVICTLTALTLLVTKDANWAKIDDGILMSESVFNANFGDIGKIVLGISILLFSFSTMIGMANYNEKCWNYLFKGRFYLGRKSFLIFYSLTIIIGSVIKMDTIINLMDLAYAFMSLPNIFITLYMAKEIQARLIEYNGKYGLSKAN